MPTIAQIIAAKKAAASKAEPAQQADPMLEAAIARIDPPSLGKRRADAATTAWHQATNAFESELCLMRDPTDSERGWLALRLDGQEMPLLLKSFMLFDHPQTVRSQPF